MSCAQPLLDPLPQQRLQTLDRRQARQQVRSGQHHRLPKPRADEVIE
jgi:hypothetical protein